jgi:dolichol-phosphate mannosyltransferase
MKICVVIPSYKVKQHILSVIEGIPALVERIYVIDDCCPENSGSYVLENCPDERVRVILSEKNSGVGGATMKGYKAALNEGMDIAVKIDGDGQMNPEFIPIFIEPILTRQADYTKGNRFFDIEDLSSMPIVRLLGNSALSFICKTSSGYWQLMDPTNGYTAINTSLINFLPLDKISQRYFFESDLLFRLSTLRANVVDIPLTSVYEEEIESSMDIRNILLTFPYFHTRNFLKRVFYTYFLRDLNLGSVFLVFGVSLTSLGALKGAYHWATSHATGVTTPAGTVMLSAIILIFGVLSILSFLNYDFTSTPKKEVSSSLPKKKAGTIQNTHAQYSRLNIVTRSH